MHYRYGNPLKKGLRDKGVREKGRGESLTFKFGNETAIRRIHFITETVRVVPGLFSFCPNRAFRFVTA